MKYVIFDTEKAKQILDASTEFYLDDVSEQNSNIFGFDRVEVNSGKRLTQYDLKIRGNGIFSAGFILKLFGSSLIVERKLRFLRGLFVTAWVLLFLYTAICGYMMTDLYQDYTIEPGDIPILTGLIVLLAGTMISFCVKTSVTKKIITSVVEEKIVRPANQESIDLEREAERLGDIMFYDEKLPDISEMTDEEVEAYINSVNPYDYLKQDNYAFTCDKNGIIQNGTFAGLKFDDTLKPENPNFVKGILRDAVLLKILAYAIFISGVIFFGVDLFNWQMIIGFYVFLYTLFYIFMNIREEKERKKVIDGNLRYRGLRLLGPNSKNRRLSGAYVYDENGIVKIALSKEENKSDKKTAADYEPMIIYLDPDDPPHCIPEKNEKKKISKIALPVVCVVSLMLFAFSWYQKSLTDPKPNAGYKNLYITYDDTADPSKDLIFEERNTPTYKWAADATAIYAYISYGYPDYITGQIITESDIDDWKTFLDDSWGITSRSSAKKTIESVIKYGHRAKYLKYLELDKDVQKAISIMKSEYGDKFTLEDAENITEEYFEKNGISTKEFYRVKGAACAYMRFGDKGLDAYDYIRLIRVAFVSFKCGYLTQNEYMEFVSNFNEVLKSEYNDFSEIHECYYYGEMFRLKKHSEHSDTVVENIKDGLDKAWREDVYAELNKDFSLTDNHDDIYYSMRAKAEEYSKSDEGKIKLSDKLEDYTFEINGHVYQLPLDYDEVIAGGFTPDVDGDTIVKDGDSLFFKGLYMGNEYSKLDMAVKNTTGKDAKLRELPINYVNGNIYRWNEYDKYTYKMANGITLDKNNLKEVEKLYGPLTDPEDNVVPAGGGELYLHDYKLDSGYYEFLVQPSGDLAGIRICKYLD